MQSSSLTFMSCDVNELGALTASTSWCGLPNKGVAAGERGRADWLK
jgi:hypothetical protein